MTALSQEERSPALWMLHGKCAVPSAPTFAGPCPELDKEVAAVVFNVPRVVIEAWPWAAPEFSEDRRWSAAIVSHMWCEREDVRQAFERGMQEHAAKLNIKGGLVEAMMVIFPDDICRIALAAIRGCGLATSTLPSVGCPLPSASIDAGDDPAPSGETRTHQ